MVKIQACGTMFQSEFHGGLTPFFRAEERWNRYESVPGNAPGLYENLYEVLMSGDRSKLVVKPEEAADVLRLIELGKKSSIEGRVILVSED